MDNHIPRRILRPYVVFISHSDKELANRTKTEIENCSKKKLRAILAPFGVKALVAEREETLGEYLEEKLEKMVQASSRIVALLTIEATKSNWVRWEIEKAQKLGKKIIPFVEKGEHMIAVGLPKTLEWHLLDKNNLSHIGEHLAEDIAQDIFGLQWFTGWRPGTMIKRLLKISELSEYRPKMVREKIRELTANRKAEDDAWYWLRQHGIDP